MTRTIAACSVAALLALGACDSPAEPRVPTSLDLGTTAALTLAQGDTVRLTATVLDQHGTAYTTVPSGVTINWSSSNNQIATVSGGLVTGVANGTATITASAAGLASDNVQVTVEAPTYTSQLSFNYSGHASGSFSVNSTWQLTHTGPTTENWAITFHDTDWNSQDIIAQRRRTDGLYDIVWFWSDGPAVTGAATRSVDDGDFVLGFNPTTQDFEAYYHIVGGSISFQAPSGGNITGGFTLSAVEPDSEQALTISMGNFNIPVFTDEMMEMTEGAAEVQQRGSPFPLPLSRDLRPR